MRVMKQLNHCSLGLALLSFLLLGGLAFAQEAGQAGNKKPRTLDDYQPRTLKEIVAMKPDPKDLRDKQDRLVVTADDLPSRVRVTYTGSTRLIPQFKKEAIRLLRLRDFVSNYKELFAASEDETVSMRRA